MATAISSEPVLALDALTTCFDAREGSTVAVDAMSYAVGRGETLGVVGESGCGKSVTALSILRLIKTPGRIESGRVRLEGRDLLALSETDMRRVRGNAISMIFQDPMTSLNPVLTVGQQIAEIALKQKDSGRAVVALETALDSDFNSVDLPRKLAALMKTAGVVAASRTRPVYERIVAIDPFDVPAELEAAIAAARALLDVWQAQDAGSRRAALSDNLAPNEGGKK